MKRSWIGFILLVLLLLGSLLVTKVMVAIHDPLETLLENAAASAMADRWREAEENFRKAKNLWDTWSRFRGCFADHTPAEEIDAAFAALEVYARTRDGAAFAGGCRSLARAAAAMGEAQEPVWWNMF